MTAHVSTVVKIPIAEIEEWMRSKYILEGVLSDFRIEDNDLVLYFDVEGKLQKDLGSSHSSRKRRARRKRNRMKTRGWEVTARITNSKGQKCAIYKPFVEALENSRLTKMEQKKLVEKILKSNRNRPSEASIQYFLENTLEYLKKYRGAQESSGG